MVFRATVIALLGSLLVLHIGSEVRTASYFAHSASQARQSSAAPAVIVHRDAPPARLPADTMVVDLRASELELLLTNATDAARLVPTVRAGQLIGFKAYAITEGSLLSVLGFENGDTILAVNDQPVTDFGDADGLYRAIGQAPFSDFQLRRHGRVKRIVVLAHP